MLFTGLFFLAWSLAANQEEQDNGHQTWKELEHLFFLME